MSETPPKRNGPRDISELKARLGLQKNRPARPTDSHGIVPPPGTPPAPAGGQAPGRPPSGPMTFAPPPGAAPDQRADSQEVFQQAPPATEYVVVNEGDKKGQQSSTTSKLIKAAIAFALLAVGIAVGQVAAGNARYNGVIDSAKVIESSMGAIGKNLLAVEQTLLVARERGPGGTTFLPNDEKLTAALEGIERADTNTEAVYQSSLYDLPEGAVSQILDFYKESAALQRDIQEHVSKSKRTQAAIADGEVKWKNALKALPGVAGLIEMPRGGEGLPVLKLVQLIAPICAGQSSPSPNGCPKGAPPAKFQFRPDGDGGTVSTKRVAGMEGDSAVNGNALIRIAPDTKVFQQIAKGGAASVAEVGYMTRIESIQERVTLLLQARSVLEKVLAAKAQEGKKFTFFL